MLTKSKIALSIALVLGTAPAAMAATKHPVHHQRAGVERQMPAGAYQSFGSVRGTGQPQESAYMSIQDQDWANQVGR